MAAAAAAVPIARSRRPAGASRCAPAAIRPTAAAKVSGKAKRMTGSRGQMTRGLTSARYQGTRNRTATATSAIATPRMPRHHAPATSAGTSEMSQISWKTRRRRVGASTAKYSLASA